MPPGGDVSNSLRARGFRDIAPPQQRGNTTIIPQATGPSGERVQLIIGPRRNRRRARFGSRRDRSGSGPALNGATLPPALRRCTSSPRPRGGRGEVRLPFMNLHAIPSNPVPEGATHGRITTADGVELRYARWSPNAPRRGTVCVFTGRGDMIEKYFEVVEELRRRGFAVTVLDWRGQGASARKLRDPRKGYVKSFDEYQLDLEALIREVVLPDCPPPFFALGHSMGALVLLQAVQQGRRWFDRIVLTAPMLRFAGGRGQWFAPIAANMGRLFGLGRLYVPSGRTAARRARAVSG
jgi:hypothetical protein